MTQIVIQPAQAGATPEHPQSYFQEVSGLHNWFDARYATSSGGYRIDEQRQFAVLAEVRQATDGQLFLTAANAPCCTDSFRLENPTEQDSAALSPYLDQLIIAKLTVRKHVSNELCCGSQYVVEPSIVLVPLLHNPTTAQIQVMQHHTAFVITGTFRRSYKVPGVNGRSSDWCAVIDTPNGERTLRSSQQHSYSGGVLENCRDWPMNPGEVIRWVGYAKVAQAASTDTPAIVTLVAQDRPYLLVADSERQGAYDSLRKLTQRFINTLRRGVEAQEWARVRREFAVLREQPLTKAEVQQLVAIMEGVPVEHRSVYVNDRIGDDKTWTYGVNPEAFSRVQFLEYARAILHGTQQLPEKTVTLYSFLVFWETENTPLHEADLFDLLVSTLPIRFERLESLTEPPFAERFFLASCIEVVSDEDRDVDPRLVRAIIEIIEQCFAKKYYPTRDQDEDDQRLKALGRTMRTCFDQLASAWMCQPVVREFITPQVVAEWTARLAAAGADMDVIRNLRQRVPRR